MICFLDFINASKAIGIQNYELGLATNAPIEPTKRQNVEI